jgi:Dolichyl-phosphate-mannose-protein mannosyltransferase
MSSQQPAPRPLQRGVREWIPVAVLLIAAAGLRYPLLDRPLWFDEVYQVYMASGSTWGEVLERVREEDRNPPLSHFFTRVGFRLAPTELGARLPSLIAGLCCVPTAYAAGRIWFGRAAGLWAAAFVVSSPVFVYYSRDARPYSLGTCALFAYLAAAGSFRLRPTLARGLGLAAAAAAAASFQYAGIIVVMVGLPLLWRAARRPGRPGFRVGVLIAGAIAGTLAVYWIVGFAMPQFALKGGGLKDAPFADNFFDLRDASSTRRFFGTQISAFFAYPLLGAPLGPRWTAVSLATLGICLATTAWAARRSGRYRFILLYLTSEIATFLALAAVGKHPFGGLRHCMPLHPVLFLALAAGVQRLGRRSTASGCAIGGLLVLLMTYGDAKVLPVKHYCSLRGVLASLRQAYRPGDWVLIKGAGAVTVIGHHYLRDYPWLSPVTICGLPLGASKPTCPAFDEAIVDALRASPRVWVIEMFEVGEPPPPAPIRGAIVRDVIRGVQIDAVLYEPSR